MLRLVLASLFTVVVGWTTVHAAGGETCASATAIDSLPFNDTGDTTGHTDDFSTLPVVCAQSAYASVAGPDLVYSLSLGAGNDLTILLTPTVATYDASIYLFEGCGATESCVMAADAGIEGEIEQLHVSGLAPGTYYLYVDSFFDTAPANAGTYGISISGTLGQPTSSTTTASTTTTVVTTTTLPAADTICVGGGTIDKAFAKLAKLGGASDDTFVFGGAIATSATLDPIARGAQILLEDLGGPAILLDLTAATEPVPPGASGTGCGPKDGWKKTTYKNTSGALDPPACPGGTAHGLKNLRFKDKRAKGKGLLFRAQGGSRSFGAPTGPLRMTIVLAADQAAGLAGECATHTFAADGCTRKKATLRCR
jgi:hypothetical protein